MFNYFKYFFSYVPVEAPPEVPKQEPPDPNENRSLAEPVRTARRTLVIICALCIAWASAQFTIPDPKIDLGGVILDFKNASVPIILTVLLVYATIRWIMEFAMMPRHIRRWPLAQFDFRFLLRITRFALLALAAGAVDRSLWSIKIVILSIGILAIGIIILTVLLMFFTMPIRIWARSRAGKESVASAAFEAMFWAGLFAVCIMVISIISIAIASYYYVPLQEIIWVKIPNPITLSLFIFTLIGIFLSHWFLRPILDRIFAEQSGYYTERNSNGDPIIHSIIKKKEPLI